MAISLINNSFINCGTAVSLPETVDANLSGNRIVSCQKGIEIRSAVQDFMQNLPSDVRVQLASILSSKEDNTKKQSLIKALLDKVGISLDVSDMANFIVEATKSLSGV